MTRFGRSFQRRVSRVLLGCWVVTSLGCHRYGQVQSVGDAGPRGVRALIQLKDSSSVEMLNWTTQRDSIVGTAPDRPQERRSVAIADVAGIQTWQTDKAGNFVTVVSIVFGMLMAVGYVMGRGMGNS